MSFAFSAAVVVGIFNEAQGPPLLNPPGKTVIRSRTDEDLDDVDDDDNDDNDDNDDDTNDGAYNDG